ncbi:hypothetical protein UA3_02547 [Enterococcus faecium EnGen0263]|uniref:GHKL domain-containing protein n=1 Tax=Enterococcus faecium TaxID=1352 RepID=UPI00032E2FA6|nr:GHKL domain-containing protein [Enterococcus faecium]EOH52421.1 hypothetical protein UA3_02547 [Enterococcus faecium EnGen0263]
MLGYHFLYFLSYSFSSLFLYRLKILKKKKYICISFFYLAIFINDVLLNHFYISFFLFIMLLFYEFVNFREVFRSWLISAIIIELQMVFSLIFWSITLDLISFVKNGEVGAKITIATAILLGGVYGGLLYFIYIKVKKTKMLSGITLYHEKTSVFFSFTILACCLLLFCYHGFSVTELDYRLYFFSIFGSLFLLWLSGKLFFILEKSAIDEFHLENLKKTHIINQKEIDTSRKFNHDYKSWLISLDILIAQQKYSEAKDMLDNIIGYSDRYEVSNYYEEFRQLNNVAIQAILNDFYEEIKEESIELEFNLQEIENISNSINIIDLIRMLYILLNNAKEEVLKNINKTDNKISCSILNHEKYYLLSVKNTSIKKVNLHDAVKKGITYKKNHSGLGLPILLEISDEYKNVSIIFENQDDEFHCLIKIIK